ncbi:MAG: molybdopterin oxidoreductase [Acidobacteria bacterium]|nr:MAG: molybdopterin oxidoreductase [Acidobacteriota bacterium]
MEVRKVGKKKDRHDSGLTRRQFLIASQVAAVGTVAAGNVASATDAFAGFAFLKPIDPTTNPLKAYPNRGWESIYRNLYTPDSQYHYFCAPNDTHGCILKANVKNGVVTYADPSFKYQDAKDIYGNKSSHRWNPRTCISGQSYVRRQYSDRRVKGPMIRKGFKDWAAAGFPRDAETGMPQKRYFEGRGKEPFVQVNWDEAFTLYAKAAKNIAETYTGSEGKERLKRQGYDPDMLEVVKDAGVRTLKHRGGMPFNGPLRISGMVRFVQMHALLDSAIRNVGPKEAKGARHWDSYSWHTDLTPGQPMVSGESTFEFDLYTAENSDLITIWGMNWIATKMPDGHWLTEARLRGTKVITIAPEYQSTTSKADEVMIIRPGSDSALALGLAHIFLRDKTYDVNAVKTRTDLPLLIREDNKKLLKASDIFPGYKLANLSNGTEVVPEDFHDPEPAEQGVMYIPEKLRDEWGDNVVWDSATGGPKAVNRDLFGENLVAAGIDPVLEGEWEVTLVDGKKVKVKPNFTYLKQFLMDSCGPADISKVTWLPVEAIESLAAQIAKNKQKTLIAMGMGPNHFFNNVSKDRALLLIAALTDNLGHFGGTVGSYSGNWRVGMLSGFATQWHGEDPFDIELDPKKPARHKSYYSYESAHYYNYDDRPQRVGNKNFTGKTHMPAPTKSMYFANGNSILGNIKWAYNVIENTLPKIEMIAANEWFWTATCEYADIVFAVDSWFERKVPDVYGSISNPFVSSWPPGPLPRLFDTIDDTQVYAGIANAYSRLTGDDRFNQFWKFVNDGQADVYLQRAFDEGNPTRGYKYKDLEESCKQGAPFYMMSRTAPRIVGWEQTYESKPYWTKTGRLEFYRDEDEFIECGENLPVHREPVEGTPYEPNVILAKPHPLLAPLQPEAYGLARDNQSSEVRQVRNIVLDADQLVESKNPLKKQDFTHVLITPKYRHACHTIGSSTDTDIIIWGPFGDFYRHDKRKPWMGEGYVDLNPLDAEELGFNDGDYIWCDGDPEDRPFVGHQNASEVERKLTRWLVRVRYNPSIARGVGRSWFHFFIATHGSVEGMESRPDKLAKSPRTNYQAAYRYGSHQSVTRAWLKPTLQTDSLVRKANAGKVIGKGFQADTHCTVGAPKESFVKMKEAEPGGESGSGLWYPAERGFRPGRENQAMKNYLKGDYISGGSNG